MRDATGYGIIGAHDSLRFAVIEEHLLTASTSTFSKRLDEFEEVGLVSRTQYNEISLRVKYELATDGDEVRTRLERSLSGGQKMAKRRGSPGLSSSPLGTVHEVHPRAPRTGRPSPAGRH